MYTNEDYILFFLAIALCLGGLALLGTITKLQGKMSPCPPLACAPATSL